MSPKAKLVAFALVLAAVIVSTNLLIVITVVLVLLGVMFAMRLPARPMLALAAYPGLFAALFAFAASSSWVTAALIVAKAVTAALAAVLLMFTTPYPQVFAPLQRMLPVVIGDSLLMTYRSLFLLLERFGHVLTAARLRAGIAGADPVRSARAITRSLGAVLLYSIDLSQRTYDVMQLRGYDGRLVVTMRQSASKPAELVTLACAALVAVMAVLWRGAGATLAPWAWIPLVGGAAALVLGLLASTLRRQDTA
jgi:energy-coupling factor transporter transmembrane protein EcfT